MPIPDSVRDAAVAAYEGAGRDELLGAGRNLYALAGLVDREPRLRKALTDPAAEPAAKRALLTDVIGGRVSDLAASLASEAVGVRLHENDLAEILDDLAAEALFTAAERDGELERVEDEVFRFSRVYQSAGDLRWVLTDPVVPVEQKRAVVTDLLQGKASEVTVLLVTELIGRGRTRDLDRALATLAQQAAARRGRVVAEVRSAVDLDDGRRARLGAALERETGRPVELHVIIDPAVVGSLAVRVGDELYDGTVKRQLDAARERLLAG